MNSIIPMAAMAAAPASSFSENLATVSAPPRKDSFLSSKNLAPLSPCFPKPKLKAREFFLPNSSRQSETKTASVPILSCEEAIERLRRFRESYEGEECEYLAMYSSVFGGITTDPSAMVVPLDDHIVHRGHAVFDTALICNGYLYELDQHLDRLLVSASMAKINLPFDRDTIRGILIQTVSASGCRNGSLRYFVSSGIGDFQLSPSGCHASSLYAVVIRAAASSSPPRGGVRVITSSVPMKPPPFASTKSVNYLPNALSQMEAESRGAFAAVWVDPDGRVAEGPNVNVAFVTREGELVMPDPDGGRVLRGCTARRVFVLAEELVGRRGGLLRGVRVGDVTAEEGKAAAEMVVIGSGVPVRAVVRWDDRIIGNGEEGPVAGALLNLVLKDMENGPESVRTAVPYYDGRS